MSNKGSKSKPRAAALAMVVSMVIANPLIESGCEPSQPRTVVDEEQYQQEQDKDNNNQTVTYGGGHGSSPFIFHSYAGNKSGAEETENSISKGGWKTWTTPASEGSYSGVHMSSFTS